MSLVDLFSALADPTRYRVVEMLHERPRPVHELAGAFDISRPAISRHLKVLKDAGLVTEAKAGRENVYSLQRAQMKPMQEWLDRHRTAKAARKPAKVKVAEVVVVAPVPPAPEPAAPGPELVIALAVEPAKPRRTPRSPRVVVAAPPPAVAPQLSFFDL